MNAHQEDTEQKNEKNPSGAAAPESQHGQPRDENARVGSETSAPDALETPPEEPEHEAEPDPPPKGMNPNLRNLIFYMSLGVILAMLAGHYFLQNAQTVQIPYVQLLRLIEQGAPDKNPDAFIEIQEEKGDVTQTVKYWDLRKVVISDSSVTGKVRRKVLSEKKTAELKAEAEKAQAAPVTEEKTDGQSVAEAKTETQPESPSAVPPAETTEKPEEKKTPTESPPEVAEKSEVTEKKEPEKEPELVNFTANRRGVSFDNGYLLNLLKDNGFYDTDAAASPSVLETLVPTLVMFGFIALVFYLVLTRFGNASAVAFGRNRGRFYDRNEVGITFHDVAGVDEAVEELREVVDFLKEPEKFEALGGKIPRGILLVGPPGTGKTLLAKAVAGEAEVPFLSLSGSDFVEMYVGVGAARVRSMFQDAVAHAPCIVFIDELDALGKARSSSGHGSNDEREQTLNALLVEMDGFTPNGGVIVLAATNRPEMLDQALLRPGRFDRQVLVDRPDKVGREKILQVHAKDVKLSPEIDLTEVATMTAGFVGADLANLINEAALLAARAGKKEITMRELNEGVERITAGLEKRSRVLSEKVKRRVAVHESAHALVAHILPDASEVHKISIIPRGLAALGFTMQKPDEDRYLVTREELEAEIYVLLAGTLGEELVFQTISTGASNDLQRATEIARSIVMDYGMSTLGRVTFRDKPHTMLGGEEFYPREFSETTAREIDLEIRRILEASVTEVRKLLADRRNILDAITARLLLEEVMDAETLKKIVDGAAQPV